MKRAGAPPAAPERPVSNLRIAVVMLLVAESMLFAGLIGAYLVFRVGSAVWPPVDLPRLPLGITWANTIVLMISGVSMLAALRSCNRGDAVLSRRNLSITVALGLAFVAIQGSEWARLVHHGLTLSAGSYGSTFYLLIGAHALHVMAGLLWLGVVWFRVGRAGDTSGDEPRVSDQSGIVEAAAIYWFFVCALWLVLFGLVYR